MRISKKQLRQIIKEELQKEAMNASNQEEIDKILDLIENDPEFQILGQFKDKFLKYMQSGGDPLSALEAASPERRPVQMALRKIRAVVKPQGPKTPMGMPDLDAADQKAAEEILSTRMGSYRGTTLPGGKKIEEEDRLGLTPDNGAIGLEEKVLDTMSPALEEKLVGKGVAKGLIQDLEDLNRTLGLFDAGSLQSFPEVHKELVQLASEVSTKLKYIKDSTRQFRESKSNKDSLKKIILEELYEACGCTPNSVSMEPPKDHSMDSQEGESVMAKGTLYKAMQSAQELDALLGDDVDLPEWLEAKLTKAADYLGMAKDYFSYKSQRGLAPSPSMKVPNLEEDS